ncbi:hypothetical protein QAD02_008306 [Eretmocerus hayati]|uniref:Uncharacterized protein n=1 Tax=Eretmocerus hayati TaxID=131215 RepID=A0ACC2N6H4_9HYME|nr:hypothetical protein QAD02_008306 [Eretmocerus hayati]
MTAAKQQFVTSACLRHVTAERCTHATAPRYRSPAAEFKGVCCVLQFNAAVPLYQVAATQCSGLLSMQRAENSSGEPKSDFGAQGDAENGAKRDVGAMSEAATAVEDTPAPGSVECAPVAGVFKWAKVQLTAKNRKKDHMKISVDNLHGFYDEISTEELVYMSSVVVNAGFVNEGWVRVLSKSETLEGLDCQKRVRVRKMNDSSLELAAVPLIDPKDIKKERYEAIKSANLKNKKVSKGKSERKSDEPVMSTAARAQLNNELLSVAALGIEDVADEPNSNNDGDEADEQDESMHGAEKSESHLHRDGEECVIPQDCNNNTSDAGLLEVIKQLQEQNKLLQQQLQGRHKQSTLSSTPTAENVRSDDMDINMSPITACSSRQPLRRSLFGSQPQRASDCNLLTNDAALSSGSDSNVLPNNAAGSSGSDSNVLPDDAVRSTGRSEETVSQQCARAAIRRRSSCSFPSSKKKKLEETVLVIPQHCDKELYENPMASLEEKEVTINGEKVKFLHLYYGVMINKENWKVMQRCCGTIYQYMICFGRNIWGVALRDRAYDMKRCKPRLPDQVRQPFTPRKLACAWRTYDGLKRKWMLLQFHGYDDGIIREIGTSASGEGCMNSRSFYGENEQHHVHDPHGGSKPLHDSDGLVALISDNGSDSGVGSSTSDWSDVENQGGCRSQIFSADNTETGLASAKRGNDIQVYDRVADSSTGSGPSMSLRDSSTANQERVRLTVCQASDDDDGSSCVVGDSILVVPCNGDFGATTEVIVYIKPVSGR